MVEIKWKWNRAEGSKRNQGIETPKAPQNRGLRRVSYLAVSLRKIKKKPISLVEYMIGSQLFKQAKETIKERKMENLNEPNKV